MVRTNNWYKWQRHLNVRFEIVSTTRDNCSSIHSLLSQWCYRCRHWSWCHQINWIRSVQFLRSFIHSFIYSSVHACTMHIQPASHPSIHSLLSPSFRLSVCTFDLFVCSFGWQASSFFISFHSIHHNCDLLSFKTIFIFHFCRCWWGWGWKRWWWWWWCSQNFSLSVGICLFSLLLFFT